MYDITYRLKFWRENGLEQSDIDNLTQDAINEIERLRWENTNMEKLWGKSEGTWMKIRDEQDAEIERLREVVMLLVAYDEHDEDIQKGAVMWDVLIESAHAALQEKE